MRYLHHYTHQLAVVAALTMSLGANAAQLADAFRNHYGVSDMDMLGFSFANLGDLDGDGYPDYAIGSPGYGIASGRVTVHSGYTGDQMFAIHGPGWVAMAGFSIDNAGDVNGDGVNDIVVGAPFELANWDSIGGVQVRSGVDGSTIHSISGVITDGCFGWAVAGAGDVDGDGYADFAVSTPFAGVGAVEVFSGLTGLRIRMQIYPGDEFGRSIANVGDFNDDGFDELLIGAPLASKAYLYDSHNGTIIKTFTGEGNRFGRSVARLDDLNGDGRSELLIGGIYGNAFVYNSANGFVLYSVSSPAGGGGFGQAVGAVPDWDGDGVGDFAVAAPTGDNPRVYLFSGATGLVIWGASSPVASSFGNTVAGITDLNGDGYNELVVGHPGFIQDNNAGAVHFFSGSPVEFGLGASESYSVVGNSPFDVYARDMNKDGSPDVITLSSSRLTVMTNAGNGELNPPALYGVTGATDMLVMDINNDGWSDVVVTCLGSPPIRFFRNAPSGLVSSGSLMGPVMPLAVTAADFNNDGRLDLAATDLHDGSLHVWVGNYGTSTYLGNHFYYSAKYNVGAAPIQVIAAHLNGDEFLDLAVLNKDDKSVSILSNKGNGKFRYRAPVALEGTPYSMAIADFNGDGKQDLATVVAGSNKASIRKGKPGFQFGAPKFYGMGSGPRAVFARDMDRDGRPDLVTANWGNDAIMVRLKKESNFAFSPPMSSATGLDPSVICAADMDCDGDIDLLSLNKTSRTVSIVPSSLVK